MEAQENKILTKVWVNQKQVKFIADWRAFFASDLKDIKKKVELLSIAHNKQQKEDHDSIMNVTFE